jgi:chemotaxis protein methyltransferase CheR
LPDLVQRRSAERALAIWSAACSSGQELYSIAMLLRENFPALQSWKVNLLGTDLSGQMVDRAQAGVFTQAEVNRGLPAPSLIKYFQRQGMQWKLNDDLRGMANWRRMNLIDTWTNVPPMDVIFLRNVLIYFAPETKRKILAQVRKVLLRDGYLFLGGAETTTNLDDSFERLPCNGAVCYRLRG